MNDCVNKIFNIINCLSNKKFKNLLINKEENVHHSGRVDIDKSEFNVSILKLSEVDFGENECLKMFGEIKSSEFQIENVLALFPKYSLLNFKKHVHHQQNRMFNKCNSFKRNFNENNSKIYRISSLPSFRSVAFRNESKKSSSSATFVDVSSVCFLSIRSFYVLPFKCSFILSNRNRRLKLDAFLTINSLICSKFERQITGSGHNHQM